MNSELHGQIRSNMNLKETAELVEIWRKNDCVEWSDAAFEIIKEILNERGVQKPQQSEPVYINNQKIEIEDGSYDFTEAELKIVEDENSPGFYDPLEVLKISKWIERAAKVSIIIVIALGLTELPRTRNIALSYISYNQELAPLATFIALGIIGIGVAFQVAITYFPLRALAHILKVLMEMEFNSRKAN